MTRRMNVREKKLVLKRRIAKLKYTYKHDKILMKNRLEQLQSLADERRGKTWEEYYCSKYGKKKGLEWVKKQRKKLHHLRKIDFANKAYRKNISDKMKAYYADPVWRKNRISNLYNKGKTYDEVFGKRRANQIKKLVSKNTKISMRERAIRDPNFTKRLQEGGKKGVVKMANLSRGRSPKERLTPEQYARSQRNLRRYWKSDKFKKLMASKEYWKKVSEGLNRHYADKDRKEKHIKAILKGIFKRPTSFEKRLIELIKYNNLPFKYVGDGEFFINGKNPDFVNTNGQKLLIEVYHWYPARKDYEVERRAFFKKYGFETIFLKDEHILSKNWEERSLCEISKYLKVM